MKSIGEEIRRLERFVARGQAEQALEGYERLQARLPRDPVIRSRVGFLRDSVHRHAPEWQVRTYVISPRAVAEAHIMAGRYADALEVLASLLELQPDDIGLARRVAMVRAMRDGRHDAGIETTASTAVMSPEMLVEAQLAAGEVEAALRVLRSMAARRPGDTRLHERLQALAEAWDAQEEAPRVATCSEQAVQDPTENLPTLDAAAFDDIGATELDSVDAPERHSPPAHEPPLEAELDTQVLEGLLADARAVIHDYDSEAMPCTSPSSADKVEAPNNQTGPRAPQEAQLNTARGPRRVPTSQRPAFAVAAAGAESGGLLASDPVPKVRITRRQLSPERLERGSAKDLRSSDPHVAPESRLLGTPTGRVQLPRSGAFDIHELLTETGTNPSIAVDSVFAPSPEPPQIAASAELASPDDFEDESTVADGFGGDRLPSTQPEKRRPRRSRSVEMRLGEDLLDESEEATVMELPPQAPARPEHPQESPTGMPNTAPQRRPTRPTRRRKKK